MAETKIHISGHSATLEFSCKPPVRIAGVISFTLAIFSVSVAAQTSGAAPGGLAEPVYSVVSPVGESTVRMITMAPRPNNLAGKTACMVSNRSFKADIVLPVIADQLKQRYPDIKIVSHHEMPTAPLPSTPDNPQQDVESLRAALKAKRCDVVVTGNGG